MNNSDLKLYLVTDRSLSKGRSLMEVVEQAVVGGVTMVQLREKTLDSRTFYEEALALKKYLSEKNIPLIINDRLDIALAVNADGLHIGQSDLPYDVARNILGPDKIIGLSVENIEDALEANKLDVDYIGLSPVFDTNSKSDISKPLLLEGVKQIANISKHPMVGIGGININNAAEIIKAGAQGVSVISAIVSQPDICLASRELLNVVNRSNVSI